MIRMGVGCCCGMIGDCLLVLLLVAGAGVGLYFWLFPEARNESITEVEAVWGRVKTDVDTGLEKAKSNQEKN